MNVIVIASAVIGLTIVIGTSLGIIFFWFSKVVTKQYALADLEKSQYNAALTMGFEIPVEADYQTQLESARMLAAKKAASLPRGANSKIGIGKLENQETAFDGRNADPVSAVRIANFHGWQGLITGAIATSGEVATLPSMAETVASVKSPDDLVPGKDYPYIEITDDLSPAEKRKARIANAKARSAAVKALKSAGTIATTSSTTTTASATVAPVAQETKTVGEASVGTVKREAIPGVDYEEIEITEDMDANAKRQARIANAKAKSAANKALKEAGGAASPISTMSAPTPIQDMEPEVAEETVKSVPIPSNIPEPDYIEITEDMDPAEIRKARIQNAKEKSAYNKALKAAGIDPASLTS